MNPHCRIGKWTDKRTGNSVQHFPDKNLTMHESGLNLDALNRANELVRQGRAKIVAVVVVKDDDGVMSGFSKRENVSGVSVLGAVEELRNSTMKWWDS